MLALGTLLGLLLLPHISPASGENDLHSFQSRQTDLPNPRSPSDGLVASVDFDFSWFDMAGGECAATVCGVAQANAEKEP